ncbi:MAG TPA: Xaa-Pro peptidase family protein [Anaerolineales bacterium]|nr:Xaa-Pro peptidase family protein [Anaerolineales bacterium]
MKAQLDDLMRDAGLEALLILGAARHNPAMVYFTGIRHIGEGVLVIRRGRAPVLYCHPMEREEAARSGLQSRVVDWARLHERAQGDSVEELSLLLQHTLEEQEVSGRVAIYGRREAGEAQGALSRVEQRMPKVSFVAESRFSSVLGRARITKDADEIDRIRRVGQITVEVVRAVMDFLSSGYADDGRLVDRGGKPVTVGEGKRLIQRLLAERGADNPEGTILSVGRDAGVPHSAGQDGDIIYLGQPLLLDLFPCEAGGGYFHDFTRTWCLGHAPDDVAELHAIVLHAYREAVSALRAGEKALTAQARVCDIFESQGHPTTRSHPGTLNGYVHSLGHGVGLDIHETPALRLAVEGEARLEAGMVFAVEPGLYYPDQGMGMRLEDTFWLRPDGSPEVMAEFPMDLVLPVRARRASSRRQSARKSGASEKR